MGTGLPAKHQNVRDVGVHSIAVGSVRLIWFAKKLDEKVNALNGYQRAAREVDNEQKFISSTVADLLIIRNR
ncbi:30S ribosomal protein S13 domain protein [Dictyocaulus viviparus]|uniref:30S ribosomal protein S13 domain protein n=1 Tax=Dictyocaulus viviparus TaxID=29172 RepID=A0A0D8XPS4_DICVI|nr:30S ribosomal protein S13 domain protein [Dictyocaulus viviparus]